MNCFIKGVYSYDYQYDLFFQKIISIWLIIFIIAANLMLIGCQSIEKDDSVIAGTVWKSGISYYFYLNTTTYDIYKNENGVWVQIGNIKGHKLLADLMSNYLELYATEDNVFGTILNLDQINLVRASLGYPSASESCRLSSAYNIYLRSGEKISLIDNKNYKYFLYAQCGPTPQAVSSDDRLNVMNSWTTDTFTVKYSGWYSITMAKSDMSEFDEAIISNQTLADYIYIE